MKSKAGKSPEYSSRSTITFPRLCLGYEIMSRNTGIYKLSDYYFLMNSEFQMFEGSCEKLHPDAADKLLLTAPSGCTLTLS